MGADSDANVNDTGINQCNPSTDGDAAAAAWFELALRSTQDTQLANKCFLEGDTLKGLYL